jgi:hypothetical protein
VQIYNARARSFRNKRTVSRAWLRAALASAEKWPCFQLARRLRASPSAVRGPVLRPPCMRQRPFFIAGEAQVLPSRRFAPHLGAACALARWARQPCAWGS